MGELSINYKPCNFIQPYVTRGCPSLYFFNKYNWHPPWGSGKTDLDHTHLQLITYLTHIIQHGGITRVHNTYQHIYTIESRFSRGGEFKSSRMRYA